MSRKVAVGILAAAGAAGAAACTFVIGVLLRRGLAEAAALAGVVAVPATVVAALAALAAGLGLSAAAQAPVVPVPPALEVPDWAVDRLEELAAVVKALMRRRSGAAGILVGVYGEGGFGKTTLALMAGADPQVRR